MLDEAVDKNDGDIAKITSADYRKIVDLCWQCKLCFNHCPYTPPHKWDIDFPRLMLRAKAARAKAEGVTRQDAWLGNVDARRAPWAAPPRPSATGPTASRPHRVAARGRGRDRPRRATCRSSTTRPSPAGSASGAAAARGGRPQGRVLLLLLGELQRAAGGARRGGGAGEERLRASPARSRSAAACPTSTAATSPRPRANAREERRGAAAPGRAGGHGRGAPAHLLLRPQEGVPDAGARARRPRRSPAPPRTSSSTWPAATRKGTLATEFPGKKPGQVAYQMPCHLRAQNMGFKTRDVLAAHPRHRGARRREVHGHGRHLGHEEGVLSRSACEYARRAVDRRWRPPAPRPS